ncbi:HAMP domain-containing protein [Rhodobacteraceae bacterium NNCM2]|nr:HAMP domain-containing protein [Coraliihabitans acroporae]
MTRLAPSLMHRLFAVIGVTALLVVLTMAALVSYGMREGFSLYLLRGEVRQLEPLAEALGQQYDLADPGWPELADDPDHWMHMISDYTLPGPRRFPPPPPGAPPPPTAIDARLSLLNARGDLVAGEPISDGQSERLEIRSGDDVVGWLSLAEPRGARSDTDTFFLRDQFKNLIIAAAIALGISGIASYVLARQFLAPIRALAAGAQTLADGDYGARIPNDRRDELGQLIDHYNELARNLETAEIAERKWMSDTSHEFQTPLAVMLANTEAIQDGVREADERTLAAMREAVLRMARLVEDLRHLTRDRETGTPRNRHRQEDFAALIHEAVDAASVRFAEAGLTLTVEADTPCPIACERLRIRQLLDNLIENTLRYTDAPGLVELRLRTDIGNAVLTIEDSPPAPPPDAMAQLFDRFFRAESSRSRAYGGSGLGLSICKAVVEGHQGRISAEQSPLGGLKITVTLPRIEVET